MKGTVFIAWGGDANLAQAVATVLEKHGYSTQVGGNEKDPLQKDFYLGPQVLKQLNRASRAIILAQYPPEKDDKEKDDKSVEATTLTFRPNLMFEWGYLFSRLLPAYLHVFLIGIQRKGLPSDLVGIWSKEINLSSIQEMAEIIAKCFCEEAEQVPVDPPIKAIVDWDNWKNRLKKQTTGEEAPDDIRLAAAIMHSIQPAFYYNELSFLHSLIAGIETTAKSSPELQKSKEIAGAAYTYYNLTKDPSDKPDRGELFILKASIDGSSNNIDSNSTLYAWIEVIRNDFLGLCYRRMAESVVDVQYRKEYLECAVKSFSKALELLNNMGEEIMDSYWRLWQGYVYRNLGRVYSELNMKCKGQYALCNAHSSWNHVYADFQAREAPDLLVHIASEFVLIELDLLKYGYKTSIRTLEDAVSTLERKKPPIQSLAVWIRAIAQARELAEDLERKDIVKKLDNIANDYRKKLS